MAAGEDRNRDDRFNVDPEELPDDAISVDFRKDPETMNWRCGEPEKRLTEYTDEELEQEMESLYLSDVVHILLEKAPQLEDRLGGAYLAAEANRIVDEYVPHTQRHEETRIRERAERIVDEFYALN